jgi:hypothetical protein
MEKVIPGFDELQIADRGTVARMEFALFRKLSKNPTEGLKVRPWSTIHERTIGALRKLRPFGPGIPIFLSGILRPPSDQLIEQFFRWDRKNAGQALISVYGFPVWIRSPMNARWVLSEEGLDHLRDHRASERDQEARSKVLFFRRRKELEGAVDMLDG